MRAFISYSHDSAEHLDRVWDLCEHLRSDGVDCRIDQHELSPPEASSAGLLPLPLDWLPVERAITG
ncbi:MAG: hypothetical protein WB763_20945 [Terriglobia bacterium]